MVVPCTGSMVQPVCITVLNSPGLMVGEQLQGVVKNVTLALACQIEVTVVGETDHGRQSLGRVRTADIPSECLSRYGVGRSARREESPDSFSSPSGLV